MAVSLSGIKDVLSLASSVLKIGENYYHASSALEDFKANIAKLESNYESWKRRARKYGLSSDRTVHSSLKEAEEQLQREEARLKSLDRGCGCLCFCLSSGTDFPAQLGKSIVNLNNLIFSDWKADTDAEDAALKRAGELARSPKFGFIRDPRYVKLPAVEKKLKNVLNKEDSGEGCIRVVLLYGRAGSGKSSMARNLALDYKQAATSAMDGCSSNSAKGCREFDDVLYVECGPEADSKVKHTELLGMLRWKRTSKTEKDSIEDKLMLEQLLKERCSLIIFDDVWEGRFLKDMVAVCGKDMRILVTSQKKYLCTDSLIEKTKSIPMDEIEAQDSIRILKVHTGFEEDEDVPDAVKKCMDILVAKVSGHPHALASVAVAIDATRKTERQQWEKAICEYDQLLEDPLSESVMNPIHDVQYERSFMEAIQVKFRRLREEERKLLVLMVMLKGFGRRSTLSYTLSKPPESVPEEVLQLFYGEMVVQNKLEGVTSWRSFLTVRKRLENLQFIKISEYRFKQNRFGWGAGEQGVHAYADKPKMEVEGTSWSIHFLDEQFIQRRMNRDINEMLEVVKHLPYKVQGLETEPQVNVIKLLGFFFFKSPFYKTIRETLENCHFSNWSSVMDGTYAEVLFLICLMTKSIGEDWNLILRRSSYQMFLSCVADGIFHNNATEELLNSSVSKHKLWTLLRWWTWKKDRRWSISEDIVNGVLRIFGDLHLPWDASVIVSLNPEQWSALLILVSRSSLLPARHRVFGMRKLVLGLADTLKSPRCFPSTKHLSAVVLSYLVPLMCERPSEYDQERLVSTSMIIEQLLDGLQEHSGDGKVHESAKALCALAMESNSDVKGKMISIGFQQLLDSLGREESLELKEDLLSIIEQLAFGKSEGPVDYRSLRLSASMTQDLSNCLANTIATTPAKRRMEIYRFRIVILLMKIDPARGNNIILQSCADFAARGLQLMKLGQYQGAVHDFEKARELDPEKGFYKDEDLIRARVGLKDWEGALKDIDTLAARAVGRWTDRWEILYHNRGFLKRMAGDLPGALEDLDEGLRLSPSDYNILKQRGYVKFLVGDIEGAQADAEMALRFKPSQDDPPDFYQEEYLGRSTTVKFLNFTL